MSILRETSWPDDNALVGLREPEKDTEATLVAEGECRPTIAMPTNKIIGMGHWKYNYSPATMTTQTQAKWHVKSLTSAYIFKCSKTRYLKHGRGNISEMENSYFGF